jgi:type IV pilus assembly protein PilB
MPITDSMKRLIIEGANAMRLADQSRAEGIWDIRKSALNKARRGITSLSEINRVTVE